MRLSLIVLLAAALAACESVQARIKRNQELFDSFPAQVQELIRAGNVAVGFTADQARMALGKPDRIIMETTASVTHEVWLYGVGGRRLSFSFGSGIFGGGRTAMSTGVGASNTGAGAGERLRLTFTNGGLARIWRRS